MLIQKKRQTACIFGFCLHFFMSFLFCITQSPWLKDIFSQGQDFFARVNIAQASDADAWYGVDWSYRKEITIDHNQVANEDLVEFPFLFSATSDDFKIIAEGGKVGQADGGDILFTLGDGTTKLSHELENYDSTNGKVDAWVKIPSLSFIEDTKLYIYYGNATISDQQNENDVWDSNFRMVQHLNETPANAAVDGHPDSTSNAMNGTPDRFYDVSTTAAEGKIGGADLFKDYVYARNWYNDVHYYGRVSLPASVLGSEESFTLSSWVKPNAPGAVLSNNGGEADYCAAAGYPYYAYYLRNVTFNTINKSSSTYSETAYSDYTNLSTTVQAGQTYTISTTNAPYMHHYIKAWIDYNQDGDFTDAGEETIITTESSYQVGHSASITIPVTALNGSTRMRVRAIDNYYVPSPCDYQYYTETEDYTVIIQGSAYNKNNTFTFGSFDTGKFSIIKDGTVYDAIGDTDLNDSAWHYLSATYGADGMKLYVDGVLKGTNNTISGSLSPLRGGFWIGRYYDDRSGQYGFDGTIDEVRVSTSARNANWIQTEYNNQNSPSAFFALAGSEARIMDHFVLTASSIQITSEDSLLLTIRAINNMGEAFVPYAGDKTLVLSGAANNGEDSPTATDKDGAKIDFGGDTILHFTDGVATTTLTLYKAEIADIRVTDGTYASSSSMNIDVKSKGGTFIPPVKPVIAKVDVSFGADGSFDLENIPEDITQIAVSLTADFGGASWEDIKDEKNILKRYEDADRFYIKFRTEKGGVSDAIVVEGGRSAGHESGALPDGGNPQALNDGDLLKTSDSPDVYIIKYKNGKRYKRLILSPSVFSSYRHLRWENIKVVSQAELDEYATSNLVKETLDAIIYMLFPDGDAGVRRILDIAKSYDIDSVYEINPVDRDSYRLEE